jgi:hypothetical protein
MLEDMLEPEQPRVAGGLAGLNTSNLGFLNNYIE